MLTILVLLFTALMWWRADRRWRAEATAQHVHDRACWAWGLAGTLAGSAAGAIAGAGSTVGAALGAATGFIGADYLRIAGRWRARRAGLVPVADDDLLCVPVAVRIASALRNGLRRWTSFAIVLAGVAYALHAWLASGARVSEPPPRASVASVASVASSGDTPQARYAAELEAIRRRYPQFNPESTLYDRRLVAAMKARTAELRSQGDPPELALRRAVAQLMDRRAPAAGVQRPPDDATLRVGPRPCAYASAMSDDDYRACGVQPPIVR